MAYQVNQHVERLAAYQPFDASFGQLYAEYVDTKQSDQLDTRGSNSSPGSSMTPLSSS